MTPDAVDEPKAETRNYWTADGSVFVHHDKGYAVAPNLRTVCMGQVKPNGKPLDDVLKEKKNQPAPPATERLETPQKAERVVSKLADKEIPIGNAPQSQNKGVMKHPGGRPQKSGDDVSRATKWRREKSGNQGVLL